MSTIVEYRDPVEGFSGWLVYDAEDCRIAAGGCRAQSGLSPRLLGELANRMTLKERLLGINVDGAKCGIDYDPHLPGKQAALRRFLSFLKGELAERFSMGCDMGTQWSELEHLARLEGIPSVKYVIRTAQGLSDEDFFLRIRSLDEPIGCLNLGQRRAGHALAQAAMVAAETAQLPAGFSCAIQGFGNLGRAAACSLQEDRVRITAVADEYGCVSNPTGLDVSAMLASPQGTPVGQIAGGGARLLPSKALFDLPVDLLILAAGEDAMTVEQAKGPVAPVIVVGANCGLSRQVELALHDYGILVVPDFVGGIGGSASMEALFGPVHRPSPAAVLDGVTQILRGLVTELVSMARARHVPVRTVAEEFAASASVRPGDRPYGCSPYLRSALAQKFASGVSR